MDGEFLSYIISDDMRTIIWDYNGTIIDDVHLCLEVEQFMLKERGMYAEYSIEDYRDLFCFPVIDYYKKLGYTFETESYEAISVEFNTLYDFGFPRCQLVDGVLEKIQECCRKGYRNVILSACRHDKLEAQTRALGVDGYFEEIMGIDNDLAASKIDLARRWMNSTDVTPEACMFIGDSIHDMETALAIGVKDYQLVACGHQSYRVLKNATDHVVETMREVSF